MKREKVLLLALLVMVVLVSYWARPSSGQLTATVSSPAISKICGESGICKNLIFAKTGSQNLKADVYLPISNASEKSPAIVFFFPGSWVAGSKDSCLDNGKPIWFIQNFRKEGYAFICVDYRLTSTASYPAQIYDAKAAIRWVRANASNYNIDPNHIGVLGWSAGGHLALMLGASVGEKDMEGNLGNANQSSAVQAVVSLVGPAYFIPPVKNYTDGSQNSAIFAYLGGNPEKSQTALLLAVSATIASHINGNEPPFLLQYGNKDTLVPLIHGQTVDAALRGKGEISVFKTYNGGHGDFDWYPDQINFFNKYLKPQQITNNQVKPSATSSVATSTPKIVVATTSPAVTNKLCIFNPVKYAGYYPDIKKVFGNDLAKISGHWYNYGIKEGRTPCGSDMPSCKYTDENYLQANPDLKTYRLSLLNHYRFVGLIQGRGVCVIK